MPAAGGDHPGGGGEPVGHGMDLVREGPSAERPASAIWQVICAGSLMTATSRYSIAQLRSLLVSSLISTRGRVRSADRPVPRCSGRAEAHTTLARLRQTILDIVPDAEQGIYYGVPAFKFRGKAIAGFAAFKNDLSYLPHSGSVFPQLKDELKGVLCRNPVQGLTCCFTFGARAHSPHLPVHGLDVRLAGAAGAR